MVEFPCVTFVTVVAVVLTSLFSGPKLELGLFCRLGPLGVDLSGLSGRAGVGGGARVALGVGGRTGGLMGRTNGCFGITRAGRGGGVREGVGVEVGVEGGLRGGSAGAVRLAAESLRGCERLSFCFASTTLVSLA